MARPFIWIAATIVATVGLAIRTEAQNAETTIACDEEEVTYGPVDSTFRQKITLTEIKNTSGPAREETRSTQGNRYFFLESADLSKPDPWTSTVFIGGIGFNDRLLKLSFIDHASGGVHAQWLNEKLLFVEVWWGRMASTDLILDVSKKTFLYEEMADYGEMIQPCH